ncbi:hypothetical protein GHK92_11900 [Nocardioides sp. dk4132]|uniref:hypothetical protein n=1 Tax=unclassified Nocardioides TaxID=2615069 RepID=UPI001296863C|nr:MULTISPECIES: hypothetical protein [unclassified Nocardioides]MQW76582.1 hypothetical protein [Nocardioides sp. dk4132]QGA07164.1 hypothetical protein GFH29_07040 [Nocardioides sp. dk884]
MPARPVATRRVTLLALSAGVLVTTGCDLDDLDPRPVPAPAGTGTGSVSEPDDDAALVDAAVGSIVTTLAVVESVRGDASLRRAVRELDRLHRAHLEELDPEGGVRSCGPDDGCPETLGGPDGVGRPGRRALIAQEQAHRATLADLAGRAASGALASVLASMSAAVAQRLAALSAPAPRGGAA